MKEFIVLSVFSVTVLIIINIVLFDSSLFKDDESMKDCQEKGGEYTLRIKPDGEVWLEKCEISRQFDYHNK